MTFRFDGQLAGAPVDPARASAIALARIDLRLDPKDETNIGEQTLVDVARWDNGDPALSPRRTLTFRFQFEDGEATLFEADLNVFVGFSSRAQLNSAGELVRVGDTGSVQADFSHTLQFTAVLLPAGYTMTAASGFDYFTSSVPEPHSLALFGIGLGWLVLCRRRQLQQFAARQIGARAVMPGSH